MDLRINPQMENNWQDFDGDVYRLTLDGYAIADILAGSHWHTRQIIEAAQIINALRGSDKEKYLFLKAHPEKLPPGVQLIE